MDSIEALRKIKSCLEEKSVRGEHWESKDECRRLDEIGQPEKRQLDLFIIRSMAVAEELGLVGLTDYELERVGPLIQTRFVLAELLDAGQIVERCDGGGRFRYTAVVAGAGDCSQGGSSE